MDKFDNVIVLKKVYICENDDDGDDDDDDYDDYDDCDDDDDEDDDAGTHRQTASCGRRH